MEIEKLELKFEELISALDNTKTQETLKESNYNIEELNKIINNYLENMQSIELKDRNTLESKISQMFELCKRGLEIYNLNEFITLANFIKNKAPKKIEKIEDKRIEISEEEFSNRCEKLIEQLGYEHEEPKLILKTQVDKKEFRVFKNKNKSIIYFAENSTNGMPTSLENLKEIAFKRKESNRKSYDSVIISKIFDNTIFDEINKTFDAQLNESLINQIRKHSEELFKLKNDFEVIQKDKEDFNTAKTELSEILSKSTTAQLEFKNAKEAAVNYAKLNASVSYWETKQGTHFKKFIGFSILSIVLIGLLIYILFMTLNSHEKQINGSKKTEIVSDKNTTNEIIQDVNKSINAIKQTLQESKNTISNNEENSKSFDFEYSKLAWYILMIFASSSVFWIIRITVKIALSNLHLSEDANERVVMIQTYLSFVNEGQIDENDKNLILSSLFRPSNIGIIKDESSVTVADIITAFKK